MAGFREYFLGLLIISLLGYALIGFTIEFLEVKNPSSDLLSSKYGLNDSYNNLSNSFSGLKTLSDNVKDQTSAAKAESTSFVFLIFQGAIEIPKAIANFGFNSIVTLSNIVTGGLIDNLGGSIVVSLAVLVIFSGLIITIVLLFIKLVRTGESER